MNVEIISMTMPVGKLAHLETSDLIAYTARVSNPDNQLNLETADKLIRYLLKKSHWSPFEMVDVTFEIQTTRDIGRQILRHRSFSFQEFSQRYAEVPQFFEERECREQDKSNRQSSNLTKNFNLKETFRFAQKEIFDKCFGWYKDLINDNVAKEQARAILPEGLTQSTMYMKGSVRSWFHFCLVRCHPGTQKEHREIADAVWKQLQVEFPFFKNLDIKKLSIRYQEMFEEILGECYEV